jgi:hypothetical protein
MKSAGIVVEKRDLDAIQASVRAGVQSAIADPETWKAGFAAMQEQLAQAAQRESGKWVVGWIGWVVKKMALGVAVVAVLYYTGGLPAVLAWLKVK